MKIPYDEWQLRIALLSLDEEKFTEEKFCEIADEFKDKLPKEKSVLNKLIAEYQGITVEQLANNPNYQGFRDEYIKSICEQIVEKLMEKFEITEKQAWVIMALGLGLMN